MVQGCQIAICNADATRSVYKRKLQRWLKKPLVDEDGQYQMKEENILEIDPMPVRRNEPRSPSPETVLQKATKPESNKALSPIRKDSRASGERQSPSPVRGSNRSPTSTRNHETRSTEKDSLSGAVRMRDAKSLELQPPHPPNNEMRVRSMKEFSHHTESKGSSMPSPRGSPKRTGLNPKSRVTSDSPPPSKMEELINSRPPSNKDLTQQATSARQDEKIIEDWTVVHDTSEHGEGRCRVLQARLN